MPILNNLPILVTQLSVCMCRVHDHNDWLKMVMPGLRSSTALTPVTDTAESVASLLSLS